MTHTLGATRIGGADGTLDDATVREFVVRSLAGADLDGRSVCVIVPDGTRSCPLPLLLDAVHEALAGRATNVTVLVALGTHAPMSGEHLATHTGSPYPGFEIRNHEWWLPEALVSLGHIDADRVGELSEGRMHEPIEVVLNRAVVDHDVCLVVGPVFPHEVVGFSGGNKYFFPGVAGQEIIDFSHWLGALITSAEIIGTRGVTPVRALIDQAAAMIPSRRLALCLVVESGTGSLHAAAFGPPEAAWAACADVSAEAHVRYLDAPVRRVLSIIPGKYDDMWTGAKGFYKVEPIVADGGQVILYRADRLSLPRLLPQAVGPVRRLPLGRPGALDPPARRRHLGPGRRRAGPGDRHARHRHPGTRGPRREPRLSRPGVGRPGRVRRRSRHAGGAPGRGGPVPPAVSGRRPDHQPGRQADRLVPASRRPTRRRPRA
jgi:hypothetical protein